MYLNNWKKKFNLKSQFYSVHGSSLAYGKIINANSFSSIKKIENYLNCISANSSLLLLGTNSLYKLNYVTDNINIINCHKIFSDTDKNKYEILIHPYLWVIT